MITERWLPFLNRTSPTKAFTYHGQSLRPIPLRAPDSEVILRRIVVYANRSHNLRLNGGPWSGDNTLLTQYQWKGGTPLTHSSTALLRKVQNQHLASKHPAFRKWESQLDFRIPDHIWHNPWLPFRSAKENTFMWQVIFRAIATLSWVFPGRPSSDSSTWCPRCPLGVKEDILHSLELVFVSDLLALEGVVTSSSCRVLAKSPTYCSTVYLQPLPRCN